MTLTPTLQYIYNNLKMKKKIKIEERIKLLIQRDLLYIIAIIFVLGAVIYTLLHTGEYVDDCNNTWQEFVESKCTCSNYNDNFNLNDKFNLTINERSPNGSQSLYKNTQRQS